MNWLIIVDQNNLIFFIGFNDRQLMQKLANTGTDHRKFMRMIVVYCDITAPLYWWKEFDTYKVGTVANSCSTMHTIADKEFTLEDFSIDKLDVITGIDMELIDEYCFMGLDLEQYKYYFNIDDTIYNLNYARRLYMAADDKLKRDDLTDDDRKRITAQRKKFWWQMIQLLPSSYNQKRTVMLNYEVIANMYKSRKSHKLNEWRELMEFFKENCPYSEIFTVDSVKARIDTAVNEALSNMKNDIYDMLLKFEDDDCEVSIKCCELETNLQIIMDSYLHKTEDKNDRVYSENCGSQ